MTFRILCLLCLARSCMGVIIDGLDCSLNCVCCKGGVDRCGERTGFGHNNCFDGCVDGIFGHRCHNSCPGNCYSCEQETSKPCYTCKATFYDTNSECSKSCSVGCDGGVCYDDGTCNTCTANFEGTSCETCIQGKYGSSCTQFCINQNCRCSTGTDCTSCKSGFHDRNTFCQTACSPGCQDGVCNDDGSCNCRAEFMGNTCSECQSGYYGAYCNIPCSVGCVNGLCSKDGSCECRPNFATAKCDTCADGRYGVNCDEICSVGCTTSSCDRSNGFCKCLLNFSGDKCDQCKSGFFEQSCNLHCSENCKEYTCTRYQGKCTLGCVESFRVTIAQRLVTKHAQHVYNMINHTAVHAEMDTVDQPVDVHPAAIVTLHLKYALNVKMGTPTLKRNASVRHNIASEPSVINVLAQRFMLITARAVIVRIIAKMVHANVDLHVLLAVLTDFTAWIVLKVVCP
ncbi:multiple epidermal growth factor-like domains protein 10 [Mya arenaria]|uniref:multiple epidermal growth factor-like domains protein 10 n=1 Tax=Mya arenaria TaxID=6604 RepID=UPI0022E0E98E|nr:multiple epidermal growth factor-like domains protein 10 [Mya arenaria]